MPSIFGAFVASSPCQLNMRMREVQITNGRFIRSFCDVYSKQLIQKISIIWLEQVNCQIFPQGERHDFGDASCKQTIHAWHSIRIKESKYPASLSHKIGFHRKFALKFIVYATYNSAHLSPGFLQRGLY